MRATFHAELDRLRAELSEMCSIAAEAMECATAALARGDRDAAGRAAADSGCLDRLHDCVCDRAFSLLALQAPVARDLRRVVAAIQIAAHADRMGGLSAKIAPVSGHRNPAAQASALPYFIAMGDLSVSLAQKVQIAVRTGDVSGLTQMRADDGLVDDLNRQLFRLVARPEWPHQASGAAEVVLVGRFYDRYADHAVGIAQRLLFESTGVHQVA